MKFYHSLVVNNVAVEIRFQIVTHDDVNETQFSTHSKIAYTFYTLHLERRASKKNSAIIVSE